MHETEKNDGFDVVAVVMERGYTNVAMDAARKAGARGGTVISARGIAENEVKRFFGIEIQAEKEIVFLVVRSDEKQQVMTALMQAVGMKTRSHGIVCCRYRFRQPSDASRLRIENGEWKMNVWRFFLFSVFCVLFGGKRRRNHPALHKLSREGHTACSLTYKSAPLTLHSSL